MTGRTAPHRVRCQAALLIVVPSLFGCALDVRRDRVNIPLATDEYRSLEVGETSLAEALRKLGAPDVIERENDADHDHLWWLHKDAADVSIRLQVPLSYFGYRHNVFQYFQGDEQTNRIHLTFDDAGRLEQKDLMLAPGYPGASSPQPPSRVHVAARVEHSLMLFGSGDFADYEDLFDDGSLVGLDINYQPVAPLVLGVGASYQSYDGRTLETPAGIFAFDSLDMLTAELMIRLQIPFEVFGNLFDYKEVRDILLNEDPRGADGWLVFVEGGAGATYNDDVLVTRAGVTTRFLDAGAGFSSSASAGIEYSMESVSLRFGLDFRGTAAFSPGDSGLPDEGTSFRTLLGTASVAVKF